MRLSVSVYNTVASQSCSCNISSTIVYIVDIVDLKTMEYIELFIYDAFVAWLCFVSYLFPISAYTLLFQPDFSNISIFTVFN